ncbi:trp operon leader peptide [Streptomyces sp. NPDC048428]|uniref:trp operon leader peptide n=1 Tax=Streptomyces sp. NPDC048428 TaxID=3154503 RepID=UPI0034371636
MPALRATGAARSGTAGRKQTGPVFPGRLRAGGGRSPRHTGPASSDRARERGPERVPGNGPAGNRRPVARKGPLRVPVMSYGSGMFAHSTRNWWWTAHPAAH